MAYNRRSPEALLGDWAEQYVAERCMLHHWHVLHTSEVGDGATMVEGQDGKVVMPDLQLFDLIRGRRSRLVEVKAKTGAYRYNKAQIDCTGIDQSKWEHYLRIAAGGVPVDLAIIHLRQPLRSSTDIAPVLLWQTVKVLQERNPMTFDEPFAGIVWDVRAFQVLGFLPNPPDDILGALGAIKRNLRIWETPPRLKRPAEVPEQYSLEL